MSADPSRYGRSLTDREHQVLRLLADGHTQPAIATRLHVSPHTVHAAVGSLLAKFEAKTSAQAVAVAYRWGLLDAAAGLGDDLAMLRQWRAAGWRLSLVRIGEGA